jgi:serpin B
MAVAFQAGTARFDHIASPPPSLWLGSVVHRALVEVNEEGTEAAAATAVHAPRAAALFRRRPPPPFTMIVDRPFFFVICDNLSQTILFMGAVNNPA